MRPLCMRSHLLYGGSHCKIKKDGLQREAQAKTFSGSVRHWAGFFIKDYICMLDMACFLTADLGKKFVFFHKHWRLLIKGLLAGRTDGRICLLFHFSDFLWCKRCGGTFCAFMGKGREWNGSMAWHWQWQICNSSF